jgi:hypothetical protein
MKMPGFNAGASVYRSTEDYRSLNRGPAADGHLVYPSFPRKIPTVVLGSNWGLNWECYFYCAERCSLSVATAGNIQACQLGCLNQCSYSVFRPIPLG